MNTPLPYRHLSDLSERQLLQVIVDKLCCVAGKYILDIYGGAAAAYSLRSLSKDTIDVVRVRRSVDNAEEDFTAREITDGTMTAWVNADMPLPLDTATAAAAYSLRNLKTSYTGSVVRVRRSVDNAEADFTASDITDGTLLSWVGGQNLLPNSEQFDLWSKFDTAVVANQATSPDATLTADLIYPTVTGNDKRIRQSLSIASGTTYTSSVFLKANGLSWVRFYPAPFTAPAWFDVANGVIGTVSSGTTASIEDYGNGWYRCSVTRTATTTGTGQFYVNLVDGNNLGTVTANGTDGILFWGAQVVEGSEAKPYVKTEANPSGIGYVTTWYDQSGNSNDATQATASSQPKIVDAGSLITENGKAAIYMPSPLSSLDLTSYVSTDSVFGVNKIDAYGVVNYFLFDKSAVKGLYLNNSSYVGIYDGAFKPSTIPSNLNQNLSYWNFNTNYYVGLNGGTLDSISTANTKFSINTISRTFSGNNLSLNGTTQEIIIYDSDQSTNRTKIENNISTYYDIYDTSANGYVATWYDQSGNNDATQATAASQPKIVDAGSLITSNGYTVIEYDGTDDNLTTSLTATGTMLMSGSDGGAFYEVAISGSYSLLASASNTDHPLNESIRVIWSSSLTAAQKTAIETAVTYTDWDFSDVTSFTNYWRQRSKLKQFPLIDTSNGTNFNNAWFQCSSLTSFPLLDVSSGTNFVSAWAYCNSLTSFPLLNVSSGTSFASAWRNCSSLTSFPALDLSSGTNFQQAWQDCSSLQTFPANMFDSVTATNFTQAFLGTNLSSQSIENIVVSIDAAGQINGTLNITGGGNATTATAQTAIDSLTAKGWTVTVPDGYQTYSTYKYRVETDGGTLYASIACTQTAINNLKAL